MMTLQDIFNTVYTGLRDQDFTRCLAEHGRCKYRANGKKCAFGHLIPDGHYDELLEGRTARALLSGSGIDTTQYRIKNTDDIQEIAYWNDRLAAYTKFKEWSDTVFSVEHIESIVALQVIHDQTPYNHGTDIQERLVTFAKSRNLTIPE